MFIERSLGPSSPCDHTLWFLHYWIYGESATLPNLRQCSSGQDWDNWPWDLQVPYSITLVDSCWNHSFTFPVLRDKLKTNDSELFIIGSKHQLNKITIASIEIENSEIKPVTSVKIREYLLIAVCSWKMILQRRIELHFIMSMIYITQGNPWTETHLIRIWHEYSCHQKARLL